MPCSRLSTQCAGSTFACVWQTWCDSLFPHGVHDHAITVAELFFNCTWMPCLDKEHVHLALMRLCVAGVCKCRAAFTRRIVLAPHYHASFVLFTLPSRCGIKTHTDTAGRNKVENRHVRCEFTSLHSETVATVCWVAIPLVPTRPSPIPAGTCLSVSSQLFAAMH